MLRFVSHLIVNFIQSAVLNYKFEFEDFAPNIDYGPLMVGWSDALYKYFCMLINCFTKCMLCMFLCMLFKREYIVIVLLVLYAFFLNDLLCNTLIEATGDMYVVSSFSIYGMWKVLPGDGNIKMAQITQNILVMLGYSGVFAVLSWPCFLLRRSY